MKKISLRAGAFLFCVLLCLSFSGCVEKKADKGVGYLAEVNVLKTGKSDCIVMESQNSVILIDTADRDSGRKVTRFLGEKGITSVDLVIVTHYDKDHIGGFETIADRLEIKNVVQPDYKPDTEIYENYTEVLSEKEINAVTLTEDISFSADDMSFEIYVAEGEYEKNDMSLVTSVTHGEVKLLFAGDIQSERTEELLKKGVGKYDFLKVPHHGIYFEGAERLLQAVSPKIAVITAGKKLTDENGEKALKVDKTEAILRSLDARVYYTKDGNLKFVSDGKSVEISDINS